jgi:hypothetical protein
MSKSIILFELNEVPYPILDYYVQKNPKSAFAKLVNKSQQFETLAENFGELSPWKTWPSLHRGVDNRKHGLDHLGQTPGSEFPPLWETLKSQGYSVGVFGSLHSYPPPSNFREYSFFVPDVFSGSKDAHPSELEDFQDLNLVMSRASARNVSREFPLKAAANFLLGGSARKIKWRTWRKVISHLALELRKPHMKLRRRTLQPVLAFDYFLDLLEAKKPQFSTFFTNHVASAMHRYWAASFPEQYESAPETEWIQKFSCEISYAMDEADEMLSKLINFIERNRTFELWLASSMGQAPIKFSRAPYAVAVGSLEKFLSRVGMGLVPKAAMFPNYSFDGNIGEVDNALQVISKMRVNGESVTASTRSGFLSVDFGQGLDDPRKLDFVYDGKASSAEDFGLEVIEIEDEKGATAYHIPEGILQIWSPGILPLAKRSKISALKVAPMILSRLAASSGTVDSSVQPNILT